MNIRKLFVAFVTTLVMAFISVVPAFAYQPDIVTRNLHRHYEDFVICDAYNVIGDFDVIRRDVTYFDNSGNPIRIDLFIHYDGTLVNSATGKSLNDKGEFKNSLDLTNGTVMVTGGLRHTTVSGLGIVVQETGRIIFNDATGGMLFVTPGMASDEALQICAALK